MRGMDKRVSFSIDGTTYDSIEERVTGKLNRFFGETEYSYAWDARPDPDSDYGAYRVHVTAVSPPALQDNTVIQGNRFIDASMGGIEVEDIEEP